MEKLKLILHSSSSGRGGNFFIIYAYILDKIRSHYVYQIHGNI